jgi:hypothetical protein
MNLTQEIRREGLACLGKSDLDVLNAKLPPITSPANSDGGGRIS